MIDPYEFNDANAQGDKEAVILPNLPSLVNKLSADETNGIKDKINEIAQVVNVIDPDNANLQTVTNSGNVTDNEIIVISNGLVPDDVFNQAVFSNKFFETRNTNTGDSITVLSDKIQSVKTDGGFESTINVSNAVPTETATYEHVKPNKSGTYAMLDDMPILIPATLQSVTAGYNKNLVDGIFQAGTLAGNGQTGVNVNQIGEGAGEDNSGNNVNQLGSYAGANNSGNNQNAFGNAAGIGNAGDNQNTFGRFSGESNTFNDVNLFGQFTQADENGQTVFRSSDGFMTRLSTLLLTATRKYIFPDKSGTFAMLDDLDTKANINSPQFTGTVSGITKGMVGLGNVDNTNDLDKPISTLAQTALTNKVDKVSGERLINADEITKLDELQNLVAGTNITITGNVISASGGGGSLPGPATAGNVLRANGTEFLSIPEVTLMQNKAAFAKSFMASTLDFNKLIYWDSFIRPNNTSLGIADSGQTYANLEGTGFQISNNEAFNNSTASITAIPLVAQNAITSYVANVILRNTPASVVRAVGFGYFINAANHISVRVSRNNFMVWKKTNGVDALIFSSTFPGGVNLSAFPAVGLDVTFRIYSTDLVTRVVVQSKFLNITEVIDLNDITYFNAINNFGFVSGTQVGNIISANLIKDI